MSILDRVRTAIGYRLIVLGQGILPADLRQIERAAHSAGINTLHEAVDAVAASKSDRIEAGDLVVRNADGTVSKWKP